MNNLKLVLLLGLMDHLVYCVIYGLCYFFVDPLTVTGLGVIVLIWSLVLAFFTLVFNFEVIYELWEDEPRVSWAPAVKFLKDLRNKI